MKVFTVGLDDKEKAQKVDLEKSEPVKATADIPPMMPMPAPIIVPRAAPAKRFGCGVLSWIVAAFFIVLLCLTISEITYNRQRDQAFLRLKWAELRQRMLGFELLSQAQQQQQEAQSHVQQPINELPAFPRRNDLLEDAGTTTTTEAVPLVKPAESSSENNSDGLSPKFDLLRMLLSKMRENAEEMGMTGDMQVHVIEVKPLSNKMPQQSIDDAFGEVSMPKQPFGPWRNEDDYNENRIDVPWHADHDRRPSPWNRPLDRFNRWDGPQWRPEFGEPQENHIFGPIWDAPAEEPQMRITHHFDKDSQTPQRVVTELFGNNAPEVIGHMLGQKNAQAQLQFQQQQQQQEMMMQQQQWPQQQPWNQPSGQPWAQAAWAPPPQMWDQPQWEQPQMPQNQPPMVYFFNQMPQQQPFAQQPPPPLPFQSVAHQNQFPFPVQNQAPIFPQPFIDNNNNNVNAFNENQIHQNQKPWYMSGDDHQWQQTWDNNNNNKVDTPFNPHPTAASPWVDSSAVVQPQPVAPHPAPEFGVGRDSDGIDGFAREEKFNVPIDVASDAAPNTIDVAPEPAPQVDGPNPHAWQHAQPDAAEEPMPASAPVVEDPSVGPVEDKDFLPLRVGEEEIGQPQNDAEKVGVVVQDDFPKKHAAPFLQIDDPSSFRQ